MPATSGSTARRRHQRRSRPRSRRKRSPPRRGCRCSPRGRRSRSRSSTSTQKFTQPPPRFTESTLVKALEENGIGRPSTYAQIIATLSDRSYVERQKGTFFPTELGKLVNRLLTASFGDLINESYTARMEEQLDEIAEGKLDWRTALEKFWATFTDDLERAKVEMTSVKGQGVETKETCPTCGAPMVLRFGRYGEYLACSNYPTCKTTREPGAPGVTEEAPACPECGAPMVLKRSRFGQFWACSRYPECKGIRKLVTGTASPNTPSGVACPSCGEGELVEKRSRRGRASGGATATRSAASPSPPSRCCTPVRRAARLS